MLELDYNKEIIVTLRNPVTGNDQLKYYINPYKTNLSNKWIIALKTLLADGYGLEKNFCFLGFPFSPRSLSVLTAEVNQCITHINMFNYDGAWQAAGLDPYFIEEEYTVPSVCHFYVPKIEVKDVQGNDIRMLYKKKDYLLNRLHLHFETLQGTVNNISDYFKLANSKIKYCIRQLNTLCHEIETAITTQHKLTYSPEWIRPAQITTFLNAPRYHLSDTDRELFKVNHYDRVFGGVYMHWCQIGKTLYEVWNDEKGKPLTDAMCSAITHLEYYSGEFDINWSRSVVEGANCPWHDKEMKEFNQWLIDNNLNPDDPKLSLGYLPIGQVNLDKSFNTTDDMTIIADLSSILDIESIEVDGIISRFDYCWTDYNYSDSQIKMLGY